MTLFPARQNIGLDVRECPGTPQDPVDLSRSPIAHLGLRAVLRQPILIGSEIL